MNKIILYIILILTYLILNKSFSPSEFGINYVQNEMKISEIITGSPLEVILIDMHTTGFLIKTYYHKYRIVHGFQNVEEIIVKTSSKYFNLHQKHLGLSIFRRYELKELENFTPLPPGSLFIDNKEFGRWTTSPSGDKVWRFHRTYRNIPIYLGWGEYRPNKDFHEALKQHIGQDKVFFGTNNEFGPHGNVTKENFTNFFKHKKTNEINFKQFIKDYFKDNF
jgi:hypothetical protein